MKNKEMFGKSKALSPIMQLEGRAEKCVCVWGCSESARAAWYCSGKHTVPRLHHPEKFLLHILDGLVVLQTLRQQEQQLPSLSPLQHQESAMEWPKCYQPGWYLFTRWHGKMKIEVNLKHCFCQNVLHYRPQSSGSCFFCDCFLCYHPQSIISEMKLDLMEETWT